MWNKLWRAAKVGALASMIAGAVICTLTLSLPVLVATVTAVASALSESVVG